MKPVKQNNTEWRTCLHGWTIPKYALYGNVSGVTYVCTNCRVNGRGDYRISVWNDGYWIRTNTRKYPSIRHFLDKALLSGEIVWRDPVKQWGLYKFAEKTAPRPKMPQGYYGYAQGDKRTRLRYQSQVDGKGSEENSVYVSEYPEPMRDDGGLRFNPSRDGMKVKQHKCRPGKPYIVS